mgnify:CR=1 FL=1
MKMESHELAVVLAMLALLCVLTILMLGTVL